jgi:hypothetical protein
MHDTEQQAKEEAYQAKADSSERVAARFSVPGAMVTLKIKGWKTLMRSGKGEVVGPVLDLSLWGMQCVMPTDLKIGDEVEISLHIPAYNVPMAMDGKIRWVREGAGGRIHVGVAFTDLSDVMEEALLGLQDHPSLREKGKTGLL